MKTTILTTTLGQSKIEVLAKFYKGEPSCVMYANRTQAENKMKELGEGWAIHHPLGCRPFYIRKDAIKNPAPASAPKYANTPHKTIEDICQLAKDRIAAGESNWAVEKDLIEGYDLGYHSANHDLIKSACGTDRFGRPTLASVKPLCSDLKEGEARPTSGPWKVGFKNKNEVSVIAADGKVRICWMDFWGEQIETGNIKDQDEIEANARLIAASPSLLAALENMREWLAGDSDCEGAALIDQKTIAARLISVCAAIATAKA